MKLFPLNLRQKTEIFTGLNSGTRQNDAAHQTFLQGVDRHGHGQIRFTGTGWADAENNVIILDGLDIFDLPFGFGRDQAAGNLDLFLCQTLEVKIFIFLDKPQGINDITLLNVPALFNKEYR